MENDQRKPYNGFIGTPAAQALGVILGFAAAFLMLAGGLYSNYCLFVFVGVVMFVIPKLFGVSNIKIMAVLGIVFMISATVIGALLFTVPTIEDNYEDTIDDENGFCNLHITEAGDNYTVTVDYNGPETGVVKLIYATVGTTSFKVIPFMNKDPLVMTNSGGNTYTYADLDLDKGTLYAIHFAVTSTEESDEDLDDSHVAFVSANITHNDVVSHALKWNAYVTGIVTVMFLLIVFLTAWMRRSLDKTRARLEAEGRLYPQGYGRCKECGMMVLPGEVVCRKCGAYIEVPEEIKAKMKHKVEYTICSECGAEVPADARKCPKCGADFNEETEEEHIQVTEEEMAAEQKAIEAAKEDDSFECSECGAKVPSDAKVCPKCGAEFDEDD